MSAEINFLIRSIRNINTSVGLIFHVGSHCYITPTGQEIRTARQEQSGVSYECIGLYPEFVFAPLAHLLPDILHTLKVSQPQPTQPPKLGEHRPSTSSKTTKMLSPIDLTQESGSEESDEDLKLAIAMSLSQQDNNNNSTSPKPAVSNPQNPVAYGSRP